MESFLKGPVMDEDSDDDADHVYLHREFGCGYNPHEPPGLFYSNAAQHVKNVSVGSTRRCKVNYLRRRHRLLAAHKLINNRDPPSVPRFNFIQDTHVSARGVETKVWRLPPAEMEFFLKGPVMDSALNEDSDDDSDDVYLQREFGCGYNPHEFILSNSSAHHIKKVSVGSTRSCKLRVLTLPADEMEMDTVMNGPVMDSALNEEDEDESSD